VLVQSATFGTSIAEALRVYAGEMRDKRVMRAEEKANKLPTKMTLATMMLTVPPLLIILVGPALNQEFGVPLLIAHLVVFWYSQDSNVTPPVCLAAFTAAGIAGARPMATGFESWKIAKGLYDRLICISFHRITNQ